MDPEVVEILCIDHVFFSLLYFSISGDWIEALHHTQTIGPIALAQMARFFYGPNWPDS